jgi:hypothetical protein
MQSYVASSRVFWKVLDTSVMILFLIPGANVAAADVEKYFQAPRGA